MARPPTPIWCSASPPPPQPSALFNLIIPNYWIRILCGVSAVLNGLRMGLLAPHDGNIHHRRRIISVISNSRAAKSWGVLSMWLAGGTFARLSFIILHSGRSWRCVGRPRISEQIRGTEESC